MIEEIRERFKIVDIGQRIIICLIVIFLLIQSDFTSQIKGIMILLLLMITLIGICIEFGIKRKLKKIVKEDLTAQEIVDEVTKEEEKKYQPIEPQNNEEIKEDQVQNDRT